jgi:hypothetical protein
MNFDRKEFNDQVTRIEKRRHRENKPQLQAIHHAALRTQHVTGTPVWDDFLRYIEGAIEQTRDQLQGWEAKLVDPGVVSDDDMRLAKMQAIICRERIRAWEAVIALPKQLHDAGAEAKSILDTLEDEQDAA